MPYNANVVKRKQNSFENCVRHAKRPAFATSARKYNDEFTYIYISLRKSIIILTPKPINRKRSRSEILKTFQRRRQTH